MATNAIGNQYRPDDSLMTLVRRVRSFCEQKEQEIRAQAGLGEAQYAFLGAMPPAEPIGTGALCRRVGLSPSRGSRVIDELVRVGFLRRSPGPDDRRVQLLALSPRGRAVHRRIERLVCRCDEVLRRRLTAADHARVLGGLRVLVATIEAP